MRLNITIGQRTQIHSAIAEAIEQPNRLRAVASQALASLASTKSKRKDAPPEDPFAHAIALAWKELQQEVEDMKKQSKDQMSQASAAQAGLQAIT